MAQKRQITGLCLISTLFLFIFSTGCSVENSSETIPVTIDLGLNENGKVRSITGKDAALSDVTAISLTVSGPGMSRLTKVIPLTTGSLTLDVPSGTGRLFQVTAARPLGNLGGSATADLEAGTPADLSIAMAYQYTDVTINVYYPDGVPGSTSLTYTINITDSSSGMAVYGPQTFPEGSPFQIPSGDGKDMEILVNTPSVTFRGALANQSLPGEETASFNADVRLYETKIVIPDYQTNYRIVQINDMTGAGWIAKNASSLNLSAATGGLLTQFRPYDIDFDSQGRIYIANYYGGSGMGHNCVLRIDDINGSNLINFSEASYDNGISAIAIDRNNRYVYYATNSITLTEKLYRSGYDNTGIVSLSVQGGTYEIGTIRGMAVDNSGLLYIAGNDTGGSPSLFRYNPATETVEVQYTTSLTTPWDVVYKAPYVYAANYDDSSTGDSIIQLDSNLANPVTLTTDPGSTGPFNGPHRFLAILNREFYIIDEYEQDTLGQERIISFDDFSSNWSSFRASSIGETDFNFFGLC